MLIKQFKVPKGKKYSVKNGDVLDSSNTDETKRTSKPEERRRKKEQGAVIHGKISSQLAVRCLDWKVNKGQDKYKRNKVDHFVMLQDLGRH